MVVPPCIVELRGSSQDISCDSNCELLLITLPIIWDVGFLTAVYIILKKAVIGWKLSWYPKLHLGCIGIGRGQGGKADREPFLNESVNRYTCFFTDVSRMVWGGLKTKACFSPCPSQMLPFSGPCGRGKFGSTRFSSGTVLHQYISKCTSISPSWADKEVWLRS